MKPHKDITEQEFDAWLKKPITPSPDFTDKTLARIEAQSRPQPNRLLTFIVPLLSTAAVAVGALFIGLSDKPSPLPAPTQYASQGEAQTDLENFYTDADYLMLEELLLMQEALEPVALNDTNDNYSFLYP